MADVAITIGGTTFLLQIPSFAVQADTLTVDNINIATRISSPALEDFDIPLVINNIDIATSIPSFVLEAVLSMNNANAAIVVSNPTIVQLSTLVPSNVFVAASAPDIGALDELFTLSVDNIDVATSILSVALVQAFTLAMNNVNVANAASNPTASETSATETDYGSPTIEFTGSRPNVEFADEL